MNESATSDYGNRNSLSDVSIAFYGFFISVFNLSTWLGGCL